MLSTIGGFAAKIFGSSNERRVRGYRPRVEAINAKQPLAGREPQTGIQPRPSLGLRVLPVATRRERVAQY